MRWPKLSLEKTIMIYHVLISFIAVVSVGYFWILSERSRFGSEIRHLRDSYMEGRKSLLELEVNQAVQFIRYKQSLTEARLRDTIRSRVYEANAIAGNIYRQHQGRLSDGNIFKIIKDALRPIRFSHNRGYYFAFDMNGTETLFAVRPDMEGKNMLDVRGGNGERVVADMISLVHEKGEGFYSYTWPKPESDGFYPKIAFVKAFKPAGWVFGTGEYVKDVEEDIQKECITWISNIHFDKDGYVFAGRYDGLSLSGPQAGKNMMHVEDKNGVRIVQELIKAARSGGGFVKYVIPAFEGVRQATKLSYAVGLDDWQWYVGAGVYADEIEKDVAIKEKELDRRIRQAIMTIAIILASLMMFLLFLSNSLVSRIRNNMTRFAQFFGSAAVDSIKIDETSLHFTEFANLARSANHMIDERIKTEKALSMSHELFLTVLDSIDANIYVADLSTHEILFMNKHMKDEYGGDFIGEVCFKAFRSADAPCHQCTNDRLVDAEGKPAGVYVWQAGNHSQGKWYINYDRAIDWIDGRLVRLQISTDITQLKKMEGDLIQARKMEAVGNLAGGVAHEFNNVLAIIIGNVELILGEVDRHDPLYNHVNEILGAGLRARDVVRQLLNFSRKSAADKKPTDIVRVVKEALKLLKASIPSHVIVREILPSSVHGVMADSTQIHQLLINLCNNAVHAMGSSGGELVIEMCNETLDHKEMLESLELKAGEYVRISVKDSGTGIPQELIRRIFDPYFTTKEVGKGTGMGLAVVHGIVKDHLGSIRVESTWGKGTVFHVYLPATEKVDVVEDQSDSEQIRGKERILFVDDEKSIVDLCSSMLQRMGYHVMAETDPLRVYDFIKNQPHAVDLVISDLSMPGMTGDRLAAAILEIRPDLPIIVCTGYTEGMTVDKAGEIGIRQVLMKPVGMRELGEVVRKVLDE